MFNKANTVKQSGGGGEEEKKNDVKFILFIEVVNLSSITKGSQQPTICAALYIHICIQAQIMFRSSESQQN